MKTHRKSDLIILAGLLMLAGVATAQMPEPVVPEVQVISPISVPYQQESITLVVAPTFTAVAGYDQPDEMPAHYRWLVKPAALPGGSYADTRVEFENHVDLLLPFDDEAWSPWAAWPDGADEVSVAVPTLPVEDESGQRIHYLFALQAMASDGVVSTARDYGRNVASFRVSTSFTPVLAVLHPYLADRWVSGMQASDAIDIFAGLEGGFILEARADQYGAAIASYRWGWNLADPDDPADPGWAVPAGLGEEQTSIPPLDFFSGIHVLHIHVLDSLGNETRFQLMVTIIPMPDPQDQLPLLVVDDVLDRNSNAWPDADGQARDRDAFRDAFWEQVADGVAGFYPDNDVLDSQDALVTARDLIAYRVVIWNGRWAAGGVNSTMATSLRPVGTEHEPIDAPYMWLGGYQEAGGNVLMTGSRAVMSTLPESPYLLPIVFDSGEGNLVGYDWIGDPAGSARVGFGEDDFGPIYPRLHGYRNAGLAAVELTSPIGAYYTRVGENDSRLIREMRRSPCVGLKGLVLDPGFIAEEMGGVAAFADTIWTDPQIDWTDDPLAAEPLDHAYIWGQDEFYDVDVTGRDLPIVPQDCDGEACVQPLWRTVSRLDWIRAARQAADPQDTWPEGYYEDGELAGYCGPIGLDPDESTARTSDQVTGFVTRKYLDSKPAAVGDVVLGFDPYRFDHAAMTTALRWVLGEHFGLAMDP